MHVSLLLALLLGSASLSAATQNEYETTEFEEFDDIAMAPECSGPKIKSARTIEGSCETRVQVADHQRIYITSPNSTETTTCRIRVEADGPGYLWMTDKGGNENAYMSFSDEIHGKKGFRYAQKRGNVKGEGRASTVFTYTTGGPGAVDIFGSTNCIPGCHMKTNFSNGDEFEFEFPPKIPEAAQSATDFTELRSIMNDKIPCEIWLSAPAEKRLKLVFTDVQIGMDSATCGDLTDDRFMAYTSSGDAFYERDVNRMHGEMTCFTVKSMQNKVHFDFKNISPLNDTFKLAISVVD